MIDTTTDVADPERRALVNAQGALRVVRTASESVDEGLAGIDDEMTMQGEEMRAVLSDVSDLSATIEEMAASAREVDERTSQAASEADDGQAAAAAAMATMESVRDTSESAAEQIRRLQSQIGAIESALAGIDDIAEQTNMLALNASIEAARSSGDSDGFAVVADEIKALAAESQEQSDEIADTLTDVRDATDATVTQLTATIDEIETSEEQVERTAERLTDVAEMVAAASDDVAAVSAATDEQASVSEAVADRCERTAERTEDIDDRVADIRVARTEQTKMLGEIADVIGDVTPALSPSSIDTLPTGLSSLDSRVGGLIQGGRAVLRYDDVDAVDLVARLCGAALDAGAAVSLTPPPGLDQNMLADATGVDTRAALDEDRLFVLNAFDEWSSRYNVFDLAEMSLSAVNRETVNRRDAPLLVVGNIAAEIRVLGEQTAREARYENDAGLFDTADTVLNVVDEATVDDTFGAFYAGAADQVFETVDADGERRLLARESPLNDHSIEIPLPTRLVSLP